MHLVPASQGRQDLNQVMGEGLTQCLARGWPAAAAPDGRLSPPGLRVRQAALPSLVILHLPWLPRFLTVFSLPASARLACLQGTLSGAARAAGIH